MRSLFRKRLDAGVRIKNLIRANPFPEPNHAAIATRLEEALAEAHTLSVEAEIGRNTAAGAVRARRAIRRDLFVEFRMITRAVTLAAHEDPSLGAQLTLPAYGISSAGFIAKGRALVAHATAGLEVLSRHGVAAGQLEAITRLLDRYDVEVDRAWDGRRDQVGATGALRARMAELTEIIALLDALYRPRFAADPRLLAAWVSARNIASARPPAPVPGPDPGASGQAA